MLVKYNQVNICLVKYPQGSYKFRKYSLGSYTFGKYPLGSYKIGKCPQGLYTFGKISPRPSAAQQLLSVGNLIFSAEMFPLGLKLHLLSNLKTWRSVTNASRSENRPKKGFKYVLDHLVYLDLFMALSLNKTLTKSKVKDIITF